MMASTGRQLVEIEARVDALEQGGGGGGSIPDPVLAPINIDPVSSEDAPPFTVRLGTVAGAGYAIAVFKDDAGARVLQLDNDLVRIGNTGQPVKVVGEVGFYDSDPVAQPAAPVTLGDVIAALQALGLVAT